jgi:hypothetical protein
VLDAGHAAEALTHLEAQAAAVGLLFTDIQRGDQMEGLELAHHASCIGRGSGCCLPPAARTRRRETSHWEAAFYGQAI